MVWLIYEYLKEIKITSVKFWKFTQKYRFCYHLLTLMTIQ